MNVKKFREPEMARLLSHCARTAANPGVHIHRDRTALNYNLAENLHPGMTDYEYAMSRINTEGVRRLNRKDVNCLCSWAVTIPKDLLAEEPERTREFFEDTYEFLKNKFGEKNVVSAYVHMDEQTPHMHFTFVPVVPEKDGHGYHLSAKQALHDCYGPEFHMEYKEYMDKAMGRDVGVMNRATFEGEKSIQELKRGTAIRKYNELQKKIEECEKRLADDQELERVKDSIRAGIQEDAEENIGVTRDGDTVKISSAQWERYRSALLAISRLRKKQERQTEMLNRIYQKTDTEGMENQKLEEENKEKTEIIERMTQYLRDKNEIDLYVKWCGDKERERDKSAADIERYDSLEL